MLNDRLILLIFTKIRSKSRILSYFLASSPKAAGGAPTKSSRSSEEGLNLEIELYATNLADSQCDRLNEPIPEGRKAPVAELIQEGSYSRTQKNRHQSANQNSSGKLC